MRSLLVAFFNATSAVAGHSFQGCGANSAQTDCGCNHRLCKQHELVIKRPFPWARKKKIQENEALASKSKRNMQENEALASDQNRIQDGKRATTRGERTRFSGPKGWVPFLGRGFGVFFWVWFSFLVQAGAQSPLSSESFPADSVGNPRPPAKRSQDRYHCPTGCPILQVPVDACAAMACPDEQAARVNTTCCAAYPQHDLTSRQPTCSLFLLHLVAAVTSLGSFVGFPTIFPPKVPYRISAFWFGIAGLVWIASSAKEASLSSSFRTKLVEPKSPKNRKSLKDFRRTFRLARARKTRRFIFSARRVGRARLRARNAKYRRKGRERRLRYLFWFLKGKGWDPLRGTRVGEASHPGPRNGGGYRRTRRKRTQKQQAAAFGLSPQDMQGIADLVAKNLAQTYNLEAWFSGPGKSQRSQSAQPQPQQWQGQRTVQLSEWPEVDPQYKPWTEAPEPQYEPWIEEPSNQPYLTPPWEDTWWDKEPGQWDQETEGEQVAMPPPQQQQQQFAETSNWQYWQDTSWIQTESGWWEPQQPPQPQNKQQRVSTYKQKDGWDWKGWAWYKQKAPDHALKPRVVAITPTEWQGRAVFTHSDDVVGKLRKSEAIQGTVTWVDSVERLRLLKDLFLSFQPAAGLTVVLTGPAKDVEGVTHTRLRLRRQDSETSLESVGLIMLGKGAPWRLPATQVDVGAVKTVKRTELRIAVPVHFRRDFVAEPQNQTVKDLLAELAKWSQVRPCHLTGGNWNWQQIHPESRKEHAQLVGWLRLPDEEAQKLLKVSGQRGIFVSQQGLQDHPKIWWMKRQESEAHSDYYKRILDFASTRSQSPVFRKGLGNHLGVPLLPGDQPLNRNRNIQISGVPKGWQAEELRDLLLQQKWSNIAIHRPVRKRRQVFWNARATPPASVSNQAAWSYECGDEFCITVNENMSRPSLPTVVTSAPGPRKKWQDRPSEDSPSNKDRGRKPSAAPKEQRIPEKSRERSRSPRETKEGEGDALADQPPQQSSMDVEVKPTRPDASQPQSQQDAHDAPPPPAGPPGDPVSSKDAVLQGWGVVDQGGVGDCAWRAIADNFWFQKEGLSLSQAESVRRGNALRAQAVQHVRTKTCQTLQGLHPRSRPVPRGLGEVSACWWLQAGGFLGEDRCRVRRVSC